MIVKRMGTGETIPYALEQAPGVRLLALEDEADTDTRSNEEILFLGEGENTLMIPLAKRQADSETVVDVFCDMQGSYSEERSDLYVANIIIPPRQYRYIETGEIDDKGNPVIKKEALPLDVEAVTLILWPVPAVVVESREKQAEIEKNKEEKGEMQL